MSNINYGRISGHPYNTYSLLDLIFREAPRGTKIRFEHRTEDPGRTLITWSEWEKGTDEGSHVYSLQKGYQMFGSESTAYPDEIASALMESGDTMSFKITYYPGLRQVNTEGAPF